MLAQMSIRKKLLVFVLGLTALMLGFMFFASWSTAKQLILRESEAKAQAILSGVAADFEGYLEEKAKIAWTFNYNPMIVNWLESNTTRKPERSEDAAYDQIMEYFKKLMDSDPGLTFAFLGSEKSQYYYEPLERPLPDDYRMGTRPWFIKTKKEREPFFMVDADILSGDIYISYIQPIINSNGEFLGGGGVDVAVENFDVFMTELNVFKDAHAFIVDQDGRFIYHPDKSLVLKKNLSDFVGKKNYEGLEQVMDGMASHEKGVYRVNYEGQKRVLVSAPVSSLGWHVVLSIEASSMDEPLSILRSRSLLLIIITLVLLVGMLLWQTQSISRSITNIVGMVKEIATGDGDLTRRIEIAQGGELGDLAHWFNIFVGNLHQIVEGISSNAQQVSSASDAIRQISSDMASGVQEQSEQTSEVSTAVQEMAAAIVQNSQNAAMSADKAEETSEHALKGEEIMQATRQSMGDIVSMTAKTETIVKSLSQRADQVGQIAGIIDDIADQTNLLALNAAIEAARAGEQGRGFAVVADEVRKLAERTTRATGEIAETISAIQNDTALAVNSMHEANLQVQEGRENLNQAQVVFGAISEAVTSTVDMVRQIAVATEEMSSGAAEMSRNINSIDDVASRSSEGASKLAHTAETMATQSEALSQTVHQFKL